MMKQRFLKYVPLAVSLVILAVGGYFVPWDSVAPYLHRLSWLAIVSLLVLGLAFHLGRGLRYWVMIRMLGGSTRFWVVALACLAAQPISVLPGGELYRTVMLRKYANVPVKDTAPGVLAQTIAEGVILVAISLTGAAILKRYVVLTMIAAFIFLVMLTFLRYYNGRMAHRWLNLLPGINLHHTQVRAYLDRNQIMVAPRNFNRLLKASSVSILVGTMIVMVTSYALGYTLSLPQAAVVYALPAALEIFSFLPGGIGVSEISAVGLMSIFGLEAPVAIAIEIIARLSTLGLGFLYGFMAQAWLKSRKYEIYTQ